VGKILRAASIAAVMAVLSLTAVMLMPGTASAAAGDPPGITDYTTYPEATVPAIFPDGCTLAGGAVVGGEAFSATDSTGTRTSSSLAGLGNLSPGTVLEMTWTSFASGCSGAGVSLAAKRADGPVFDENTNQELINEAYHYCGPQVAGVGSPCVLANDAKFHLTINMPSAQIACNYQIDAVVGRPLAVIGPNGSYYRSEPRIAHGRPGGRTTLISANNGGCKPAVPEADAVLSCARGGVLVTVGNTGEKTAAFELIVQNGANPPTSEAFTVAGGTTGVTRSVAIPEGQTRTITVKADGVAVFGPASFTRECEQPAATIAHDCASDQAVVTLTNPGESAAVVQVVFNGVSQDASVAAGGAPTVLTFNLTEDEPYTLVVTDETNDGVVTLASDTWTQNCEVPGATIASSCATGTVVTLTNTGESPTTITVRKNGEVVATVDVAAGGTADVAVPFDEDETATVTAEDEKGNVLGSEELTRDCFDSSATITAECVDETVGQITVTITNDGELDGEYAVTKDGVLLDTVAVAAGVSATVNSAIAQGASATVAINGPDGEIASDTVSADCVAPNVIERPETPRTPAVLPATGTSTTAPLLTIAGLLLLGGGLLLMTEGQRRLNLLRGIAIG
jgi:hypothetical protein